MSDRESVAVVGAGVSGVVAAWLLQHRYRVTLFEKEARLGGHSNTVVLDRGVDEGVGIDTGFIVLNDRNYPSFSAFLERLGVPTQPSDMTFSVRCERCDFCYAGTGLSGLFARRRHLVSPRFYRFLASILAFNRRARQDLAARRVPTDATVMEYLDAVQASSDLRSRYVAPMAAAIWSTPASEVLSFPAEAFLRFFEHHGLLQLAGAPRWRTVVGGSHSYLLAFERSFSGTIRAREQVLAVRRHPDAVSVATAHAVERFDRVVIATHADEALALIVDPSPEDARLLGPWRYQSNHVLLHTDVGVLPTRRSAWASWNFSRSARNAGDDTLTVTYYMNRLQRLRARRTYCVTLNAGNRVREEHILREFRYAHPRFTAASLATQAELRKRNERAGRTLFCGSYFGYGFHEDAVRSSVAVASALGVSGP